ncbi:MFS transporter [Novosphingobium mangrovi (ex Hu et al. 2023)]|uniref:MFS transporter n=1 Tax=Novosphingobium mangrovi (ex Hu et al. 2023) TaxID=2930094 RepID=A0ABT0ADC2_9SPHN|nr:MFS transporter [Novosphingobium mangrovi (ex Hu et al. 2023)]MCJ1961201.1 MFS transporter [Novosphingobium mangrovi (ex Hu et al. 2023)]
MTDTTMPDARQSALALLALGLGAFAISTSEFASMGLMPLFAGDLDLSIPAATNAITAYAVGVTLGAPVLTIAAARLNKKRLLIALIGLAFLANLVTAMAGDLISLVVGRFFSGLPQGVYFGAASVVATRIVGPERAGRAVSLVFSGISIATILGAPVGTWIGQQLDWRAAYTAIGLLALVAGLVLAFAVPQREDLAGGPIRQELASLRRIKVWIMVLFGSFAVSSLFAIYTFIGPLVTDVAGMSAGKTPLAQMLIGFGIALGALWGGGMADRYRFRALILSLAGAMVAMLVMYFVAAMPVGLMAMFFVASFLLNAAVPSITVQMMRMAPESPTMMGALNMAAFNIANAVGAIGGALTVEAGWGLRSPILAGLGLTGVALAIFALAWPRLRRG